MVVGKVLASAVANAGNNDGLDAEELYVSACYADEGTTLKRWRPRARGRATRIRKRTCHITVIVSRLPDDRLARRRARQAGRRTLAARPAGWRRRAAAAAGPRRGRPSRRRREADETRPPDRGRADEDDRGTTTRRRRRRRRGEPTRTSTPRTEVTPTRTTTSRGGRRRGRAEVDDEADDDRRRRPRRDDADGRGASRRRGERLDGPEGQPLRVPPRRDHRLEVALVRGAQLPGLRDRGLEDPRLPHVAARVGRREPHRDRAHP